jgi:hypothetical protein
VASKYPDNESDEKPDVAEDGDEKTAKKSAADKEVLRVMRERFDMAEEADREVIEKAREDKRFAAGDQWPEEVKAERNLDKRPCITVNKTRQHCRQVINDNKQNKTSIKVSPVDDKGDPDTAKIYQGLIRHIENQSNADVAYNTGFQNAVESGFGYWRVVREYSDPMSFTQELRIMRVRDQFSVRLDPSHQQPDGSDANWGFVFDDILKDDYIAQHPDSELAQLDDWAVVGKEMPGWASDKMCRIAEYFCKVYTKKTLHLLHNGDVITDEDLQDSPKIQGPPDETGVVTEFPVINNQPFKVIDSREAIVPQIKHYKVNGVEILEETDWPGIYVPIVPVLGEEHYIDGKRVLEGIVRHAKDPARMYNYFKSMETETIALAPRTPYIGMEGQFEGFESQWRDANRRNHAFLQYKGKTIGNQPAPPPQRQSFEPPVAAITNAGMQAADDIKATTGQFDASMGARSNETSGKAINARANQAQTSNFHFFDSQAIAKRHTGRILVDLIPHVYDTAQAIRILGEDNKEEIVKINQEFIHKGEKKFYDLGRGKYDVQVSSGPGWETKRQENLETLIELSGKVPKIADVGADIIVSNMDFGAADELSQRLRKTLPPGIADDPSKPKIPPQVQAQLQQMDQTIHQLTQKLNEATEAQRMKSAELESKERIATLQVQADLEIALAKLKAESATNILSHDIERISARLNQGLDFNQPFDDETQEGGQQQPQPQPQNQNPNLGNEPGAGPEMGQPPIQQQPLTGEPQPPGLTLE